MNSPIEEIKRAVAENHTSDALSRLLELSQSDKQVHDIIVIISGEFRDLNLQQLKGIIDNKEATQRLNAVHSRILDSLNLFDSQGRVLPGRVVGKKTSAAGMLGRITLLFAVAGVLLFELSVRGKATAAATDFLVICFGLLFISFCSFIAYLLAIIVSASKK